MKEIPFIKLDDDDDHDDDEEEEEEGYISKEVSFTCM